MLPITFSGWMVRFLRQIGKHYGIDAPLHRWEPHVALKAYEEMIAASGVRVIRNSEIDHVVKESGRIRRVGFADGSEIEAAVFIDASYEGDLMAKAGIPYSVGREARETYNESYAGIRFIDSADEVRNSLAQAERPDKIWELDLSASDGKLIEGVTLADPDMLERGRGDGKVMNYHFRVTVTKAADRIPFQRPADYQDERYELLSRFLHLHPETRLRQVVGFIDNPSGRYVPSSNGFTDVLPGDKWELNNHQDSILSLGYLGGQFRYPDGTPELRKEVIADHYSQNAGMLYFLSNSTSVPSSLREEANLWGLPPDEFVDNNHWPYQPYIRETRRMKGSTILTQHDVLENRDKNDNILWNSHWIDSHHVERLALDRSHFRNEGRIWHEVTQPYAVPYRSILPCADDATNLLVPGCLSASHVAFCSIRLESTWMGLGEAAAAAAVQVLESNAILHEIDIKRMQKTLSGRGVNL
jgi:hypothetical protein